MADNYMQKKCDFCGETIPVAAGRCPYCGSILEVVSNNDYRIDAQQGINNNFQAAQSNYTDEGQSNQVGQGDSSAQPQSSAQPEDTIEAQAQAEEKYTEQRQNPLEQQGTQEAQRPMEPQNQIQYNPNNTQYNPNNTQYNPNNAQYNVQRPYYKSNYTDDFASDKEPLSNGLKVFLTILFAVLPGIGQLAGIITAIVFMNSVDKDRKSFGVALLVASLILFVLVCIGCFVLGLASQSMNQLW